MSTAAQLVESIERTNAELAARVKDLERERDTLERYIAAIRAKEAEQAKPAMPEGTPVGRREDIVAAMEQIAKTPYSTCRPAPAFKAGDRVFNIDNGEEGVVEDVAQHGLVFLVRFGPKPEFAPMWCYARNLSPAPAEQKPGIDYTKIAKALGTTIGEAPANVKMACAAAGVALAEQKPEAATSGADCDCRGWASDDMQTDMLGNGHHHNCKHFKPNVGAIDLLKRLVKGIDFWASQEDGVPDEIWDAFCEAAWIAEGRPFPKKDAAPAPKEAAFGGPHDDEAVKWAKERGEQVAGHRAPLKGDRFIMHSDSSFVRDWIVITAASNWPSRTHYYILAPEAAKVDTLDATNDPNYMALVRHLGAYPARLIYNLITARMEGKR